MTSEVVLTTKVKVTVQQNTAAAESCVCTIFKSVWQRQLVMTLATCPCTWAEQEAKLSLG